MLTTVVVPAYNTGEYLVETVGSVLRQTDPDWVLNIIDDGSTDDTPARADALAASDGRIRVFHQRNGGMACARNAGVRLAHERSDAVLFLDHDDVLKPDALRLLRHALDVHPEAPAAYGLVEAIDRQGEVVHRKWLEEYQDRRYEVDLRGRLRPCDPSEPMTFAMLAYRNGIITMGQTLIRRDALERTGGLHAESAPCDDYDLYLRLAHFGPIVRVHELVVSWRDHGGNTSADPVRMGRADHMVRQRALLDPTLTTEERDLIRRGWHLVHRETVRFRKDWALEAARRRAYGAAALEAARMVKDLLRTRTSGWMSKPPKGM